MNKSLEKFINDKRITYDCEGIIYPNGDIIYANPSHIEALLKITKKDKDEIYYELMPISASPIIWLTYYTNCIPIWNCGYYKTENTTSEQLETLKYLTDNNFIADNCLANITKNNCIVLNQDRESTMLNKIDNKENVYQCSTCNRVIKLEIKEDGCFFEKEQDANYCPFCGRKIIKDEKLKNNNEYDLKDIIKLMLGEE